MNRYLVALLMLIPLVSYAAPSFFLSQQTKNINGFKVNILVYENLSSFSDGQYWDPKVPGRMLVVDLKIKNLSGKDVVINFDNSKLKTNGGDLMPDRISGYPTNKTIPWAQTLKNGKTLRLNLQYSVRYDFDAISVAVEQLGEFVFENP